MNKKIFYCLHYICLFFFLAITLYAFVRSLSGENMWGGILWGIGVGLTLFIAFCSYKSKTAPRLITSRRRYIQLFNIFIFAALAVVVQDVCVKLIVINCRFSAIIYLFETGGFNIRSVVGKR